ncbi:leucyl aminopeptidase [Formicincola oecophyllae]|uniref:Probable cytosol aminopeptidase n=1 Tax=Formicincola oecophyllae TaxID=2558361 RepID=A0A4Y6UAC5_9PROT|nr:leucyl aminopeptidase [Formicincola oecophyllae]QDH13095.1 leucyl aminopeptidase [Formicincola oecophyllae]
MPSTPYTPNAPTVELKEPALKLTIAPLDKGQSPDGAVALLCAGDGFSAEPLFKQLDQRCQGALSRAAILEGFGGWQGTCVRLLAPAEGLATVVLVGAAPKAASGLTAPQAMTQAGAAAARALAGVARPATDDGKPAIQATLLVPASLSSLAAEAAEGAFLASWRFDRYKTGAQQAKVEKNRLHKLTVALADQAALGDVEKSWSAREAAALGTCLARDFVSEPSNVLTPAVYAGRIKALETLGLDVELLDVEKMAELGFGALLGVAQGSVNKPWTVIVRWNGAAAVDEAPVVFVGKGVTFDSGGISIKPSAGMDEMKADMGGSAAVIGTLAALARRKAPVNAIGIVGLVENMPGGEAQRPGDIVKACDGQTIEVLNTDAEGRLVLADLLAYSHKTFQPRLMVDLATLTGAIVVALGTDYAGLFSTSQALSDGLAGAGAAVEEKLWPMPLGAGYARDLESPIADMKNIGTRAGSSCLAAEFLRKFVGNTPWAHLDIAGVAWVGKPTPIGPKGATGFGVRLLDRFVSGLDKLDLKGGQQA